MKIFNCVLLSVIIMLVTTSCAPEITEEDDFPSKQVIFIDENEVEELGLLPVSVQKPLVNGGEDYTFTLSLSEPFRYEVGDSEFSLRYCIAQIDVYNTKTNKKLCQISEVEIVPQYWGGLFAEDANFDNYTDVIVNVDRTGNAGHLVNSCWLWNEKTQQFESQSFPMWNARIDTKEKCIRAAWRGSGYHHGFEIYRFIDGEFVMTNCLEDLVVDFETRKSQFTERTLVNGEMQVREWFVLEADNETIVGPDGNPFYQEGGLWNTDQKDQIYLWHQ